MTELNKNGLTTIVIDKPPICEDKDIWRRVNLGEFRIVYVPLEMSFMGSHFRDPEAFFGNSMGRFKEKLTGIVVSGDALSWNWEGPRLKYDSIEYFARRFRSIPAAFLSPHLRTRHRFIHAVNRIPVAKFNIQNYHPQNNVNIVVAPIQNSKRIDELLRLIPNKISNPRQIRKTFIYVDSSHGVSIALALRKRLQKVLPEVDAKSIILTYMKMLDCLTKSERLEKFTGRSRSYRGMF